jgi:hypothetical protein
VFSFLFLDVYCTGWRIVFFVPRVSGFIVPGTVELKLRARPTDGRMFCEHATI